MAILENNSGFAGDLFAAQDIKGYLYHVLVVRGTFEINPKGEVVPAVEQEPVCLKDEYFAKPGQSSIKCESDLALYKPGTDVILLGHAYAKDYRATAQSMVQLQVADVSKRVAVFGDRVWKRRLGFGHAISDPKPFIKMPLVFELAFGGSDTTHRDPSKHDSERRNPVGKGFRINKPLEGLALPNLEDPENLIHSPADRPGPHAFGFVARNWEPRIKLAGTYDDKWRREQMPLLPEDFDYRYFQAAHPDLICEPHLKGIEEVRIVGATPQGELRFDMPAIALGVAIQFRHGNPQRRLAMLDTVVLRPDERKFNLVWRALIRCPRKISDVERVVALSVRWETAMRVLGDPTNYAPGTPQSSQ